VGGREKVVCKRCVPEVGHLPTIHAFFVFFNHLSTSSLLP
jgi:hypothetical protein